MSTIRLRNVTKVFSRSSMPARSPVAGGRAASQTDRAYAERVAQRAASEFGSRTDARGDILALDRVNLTVPDGQTYAVVGPSGCGKSTLLRVVAGLTDYSGEVYYDDQPMEDVAPKDRYIGMVFQNYALYPHFESKGNLAFFFRMHKVTDEETEERIRITSEIMGIGFNELLKRKPGILSGGQQQRVAIARALVRNPRLFLFDEPLSNLDAKLRTQTRVEIKRLLHRFGITALYVTHDQVEAIALGDRIAVMRAGEIEQVGTYQELREDPINAFVAGFIGQPPMNLFKGGTAEGDAVRLGELSFPLPATVARQVRTGQGLIVGIHSEAAQLVSDGPPAPEGARLRGTVDLVEPDFSRRTATVYVHIGQITFSVRADMESAPGTGDEAEVLLPVGALYLFDAESELRIGG